MPDFDFMNPASVKAWEDLSKEMAGNASGNALVVLGQRINLGSVFTQVELKALKENPKITKITAVFPHLDGAEKVLYTRSP